MKMICAPADLSKKSIAFPAVAEHHVMGGLGLTLSDKLGVNVGFMFAPTSTVAGANGAPPPALGGDGQGITSYEARMSQWAIDAGLAYRY
jgi:hypothetical protein